MKNWFKKLFINRNIFNLFAGQTISQSGDTIFEIALLWLLLDLTGSNAMTGLIAMAAYLPTLLFGLFSGALVDTLDKRRIMLWADIARAILVLCIPLLYWFGGLNGLVLGLFTFAIASFNTFFNPARDSIVGNMVEPAQQLHANSLIHTSWQFATFLGPALAGILLLFVTEVQLFVADAATFLLSFYFIYKIALPKAKQQVAKRTDSLNIRSSFKQSLQDVRAGLQYVAKDRRLLVILFMTISNNLFLMGPALIGAPIFVREILHEGVKSYAFVNVAYGIGMFAGTVLLNKFKKLAPHISIGKILVWGIFLDGITFLPLLWVTSFWGMFVTIAIHAMAIPLIIVTRPTIMLNIVPPEMQGRVFSMVGISVQGVTAISIALTGVVADIIPINVVYGIIAVLAASTGIIGYLAKDLWELD